MYLQGSRLPFVSAWRQPCLWSQSTTAAAPSACSAPVVIARKRAAVRAHSQAAATLAAACKQAAPAVTGIAPPGARGQQRVCQARNTSSIHMYRAGCPACSHGHLPTWVVQRPCTRGAGLRPLVHAACACSPACPTFKCRISRTFRPDIANVYILVLNQCSHCAMLGNPAAAALLGEGAFRALQPLAGSGSCGSASQAERGILAHSTALPLANLSTYCFLTTTTVQSRGGAVDISSGPLAARWASQLVLLGCTALLKALDPCRCAMRCVPTPSHSCSLG